MFAGLALAWLADPRTPGQRRRDGRHHVVRPWRRRRGDARPRRRRRLARPARWSPATTTSAPWPATGSSRPSTSVAIPRRWPGSASTSTSRAAPTPPTSTTRRCSTSRASPPGTRIRFATMDRYDGMVWGATDNALPGPADDSFQRVSSTIDNPVDGQEVDVTSHPRRGLDGRVASHGRRAPVDDLRDRRPARQGRGVPLQPRHLDGSRAHRAPAGRPLLVHRGPARRRADRRRPSPRPRRRPRSRRARPSSRGRPRSGPSPPAATRWPASSPPPSTCASEGKYSDGVGRTERIYVAGHSVWRLSDEFVNAPQIVGNDEQYAATMALIANDIGVPARVVLGAVVPEGGRVTGQDVSAWVELRAADGSWRTLPDRALHVRRRRRPTRCPRPTRRCPARSSRRPTRSRRRPTRGSRATPTSRSARPPASRPTRTTTA